MVANTQFAVFPVTLYSLKSAEVPLQDRSIGLITLHVVRFVDKQTIRLRKFEEYAQQTRF